MSDYVHKIAIRYKLGEDLLKQCITENSYISTEDIAKLLGLEPYESNIDAFNVDYGYNYDKKDSKTEFYLDYITYYTYGEDSGDYTFARYLNRKETCQYLSKFRKFLSKYNIEIKQSNLRRVDYCYYNGVDAPACYEVDSDEPEEPLDRTTLIDFFISSVDSEEEPIWTEKHIDELLANFDVLPKIGYDIDD